MKALIFLFLSLIAFKSFSQDSKFEKPNYDEIEQQLFVLGADSEYNYPNLFKRFLESDTTLTLDEKRFVYYGYSYQKEYSPYSQSEHWDTLEPLLSKEKYRENDLRKIVKITDSILEDSPFDLRAFNYQIYALDELGKSSKVDKRIVQTSMIYDAILSSGDGVSAETAFYVIYTTHEYNLLSILELEFGGQQSLIGDCDYLKLADKDLIVEGLYFNVSRCLKSLSESYK